MHDDRDPRPPEDEPVLDMFLGEWRQIGTHVYSTAALPESLPTWVLQMVGGANSPLGGLVAFVVAFVMLRRRAQGPWIAVVYRSRRYWGLRTRVVHRVEFAKLDDANEHARVLDQELEAGRLPGDAP